MSHVVRAARADELAACAALYERVVRETFTWVDEVFRGPEPFLRDAPLEECYVVDGADGIVGLASFRRPDNVLHSLYVDSAARGQGVGGALFEHVRAFAPSLLSVQVQKLNRSAIAFYERRGMEIVGEGELDAPGGGWFRMRLRA